MTEAERIHSLRRMKVVATSLLLVATLVFLVSRATQDGRPWVEYVRAFAEAAMVGALADWFAVTALFRHPLGIPIPHTAIIPNRKDQIGRSLGEFVQGEFLNRDVIVERLEGLDVSHRLGSWLTDPVNARRAGDGVADALRGTLEVLDDDDVQEALEHLVERRVRATPVAPLIGRAVDLAVEGGHHQRMLDSVLIAVRNFLDDNRSVLRKKLDRESPWWVPEPIDDRIFSKIYDGVHSFLGEVAGHPEHEVRHALDARILDFAERLRHDPTLVAKGEELKEELLAHPDIRAWLATLWSEIKRTLITASSDSTSELRTRLDAGLVQLGNRLCTDPELQHKVDSWVERAVAHVVDTYRNEVSELIGSTVERWDADATSRKMELQVGRDLQFIRINGTLVGGLAGLVIHIVGELFF
ncbi:MAG: DUF445 domain-containing protein [Acidimicrobiia bacterium]